MANPFIKYEDCLVTLNDKTVFATEASISVNANVSPSRDMYGRLLRYSPQGGAVGSLNLSFYPTKNFHNNYQEFDIINIVNNPEHLDSFINGTTGSFAGVDFSNAYLKSLSFSVEPFSPIQIRTSFDVYGSLTASSNIAESFDGNGSNEINIPNGVNSYFVAATSLGLSHPISFNYSANINTSVDYYIGSIVPSRVSRASVDVNMDINGERFGDELHFAGNNAAVTTHLYPVHSTDAIGSFLCSGVVVSNQLNASSNQYLRGSLSLNQSLK